MNRKDNKRDFLPAFLRSVDLFRSLDENTLKKLECSCIIDFIPKGKFIFMNGETPEYLYLVKSGFVSEYVFGPKELEMIISTRRCGDFFGEMSMILESNQVVSTLASTDCVLVKIPKNIFLQLLRDEAGISGFLLRKYAFWLIRSGGSQAAYAFLDAAGRLAFLILTLETDAGGKGMISISQEELALNCGLARQTVARLISEWKEKSLVKTGRRKIFDIDCKALMEIIQKNKTSAGL